MPSDDSTEWYFPADEKLTVIKESLGILNLEYLQNEQIVSNYIHGPHGWCAWDVVVRCGDYNIGKYPSVKEIFNEWPTNAKTWPFMKLRCQLWNGECDNDDPHPVIEFSVDNSMISLSEPMETLSFNNGLIRNFSFVTGERGRSLDDFK